LKTSKWLSAVILGLFMLPGTAAFADKDKHDKDRGDDHGNGHWREIKAHKDYDDDDDRRGYGFAAHDRDEFRGWYAEHYAHLPPGLAKKDRLPPGLEKQLVLRGKFPPGLESRIYVIPADLQRRLPPPPRDCERVVVGGHIVLRNRQTKIVVDIFHFE